MIYLRNKEGTFRMIVLETANIEHLKSGGAVSCLDEEVFIRWTPDAVWLAEQIQKTDGGSTSIDRLIAESQTRPEAPVRDYHEPVVGDFDRPVH